jgi:short-chain Z-isoprenyl diphosphate synthase
MGPSDLLYRLYERRLAADLRRRGGLPRHVGVILDGNRRWARELGMDTSEGHRRGAAQIDHLLSWSAELGIPVVTLWLLSTENLLQRHPAELAELLQIIEAKVVQLARDGAPDGYRIVPVGQLEALPERTRATLLGAERASRAYSGGTLHVAVGYGGREEIADAVRRLLAEYGDKSLDLAEAAGLVTPDEIARHSTPPGCPTPT